MGSVDLSGCATSESGKTYRTARSRLALPGICEMSPEAEEALVLFLTALLLLPFSPELDDMSVEDLDDEEAGRDRAKAAVATAAGVDKEGGRVRSDVDEKACWNQPVSRPEISARRAGDPRLLFPTRRRRRFCSRLSKFVTRLVGRSPPIFDIVLERAGRGVEEEGGDEEPGSRIVGVTVIADDASSDAGGEDGSGAC